MSIVFDRVSFRYPGTAQGIVDLELELASGELLAVIGPSGSGKTTLLRLLAGFVRPQRGRIVIDGQDVTALPPRRRNLGIVPQAYALFPHMQAWQNVAYPLKVRGLDRAGQRRQAEEALALVGLAGFAERRPAELSGGQQQRVALARALVFRPRALLLDEPLSALDAALRVAMRDEIVRVQRSAGIATLHVTHDQEEALSIADRVAVVLAGRLVQVDSPRRLYDRPVNRTVAAFVGQANLIAGHVVAPGQVALPFGTLACATAGHAPGSAVTLLVRPEQLDPAPPPGAPNRFAVRLGEDRFLGPVRRFDAWIGEQKLTGETSRRDAIEAIAIPPERVLLLPEVSPPSDKGEEA